MQNKQDKKKKKLKLMKSKWQKHVQFEHPVSYIKMIGRMRHTLKLTRTLEINNTKDGIMSMMWK